MANLFDQLPEQMEAWKKTAEGSRFFGQPISEMDRDELLAIIGQLIESKEQSFADHVREREFWRFLSRRAA